MRKLILSMLVSLDNLTARPDGDLNWFRTDEEIERELLSLVHSVDEMLLGRVTYQLFSDYWPTAGTPAAVPDEAGGFTSKELEIEFAGLMNSIPKVVVSRTLTQVGWGPARLVSEGLPQEITAMKARPGKDFVAFGGATLATTLMDLDLVDDYRLLVHPIILGSGPALFGDVRAERPLTLQRATTFPSGVVLLHYQRDRSA